MYTHLFVPIDGSELGQRAAKASIGVAQKLGARITGFVAEPMPPLPTESSGLHAYARTADEHMARTEAHAREILAKFGAQAAEAGVPFEGKFKRSDAIDQAIAETADELGCDLLVMATHGRGAIGEFLYGSHTKHVLSLSKLPLLVVR